MADDKGKVDGASGGTSFENRDLAGGDPGRRDAGNTPVAQRDASADGERNPLAYRDAGDNGRKRAEHMERAIIDHFYGGSVRRYDEDAGLDFDAA